MEDLDGARLLTSGDVAGLLAEVVGPSGASLEGWSLSHVDADPGRSTTATYKVRLTQPGGLVTRTVGLTVRAQGPSAADARAAVVRSGEVQAVGWLFPHDPDLPGLARAASRVQMTALLNQSGFVKIQPGDLELELIGYRPRRRAVLKVSAPRIGLVAYVKVFRPAQFEAVRQRHEILSAAGLPSPRVLAATTDHVLVIESTVGRPLARALFDRPTPVTAEQIVELLDALPAQVAELSRRPPWAASVRHYAGVVEANLPSLSRRLSHLVHQISTGLADLPAGEDPTHGDFYEAQIFVQPGRVSGLIDVDTIGPGRRADDLACLLAHLNCIQRMNSAQAVVASQLIQDWLPVFEARVDPVELRLRAAAVVVSLATGPFRCQEPDWRRETEAIVAKAERLVAEV
ncbi:MAG: phosphotransferase [Propionibacteriaceae bacterium]|jgi:aminoglycoside phosphotransferase|nr:phosphotransferase [Propionibacteriaceae bacterium]